jgi:hypothetical protein
MEKVVSKFLVVIEKHATIIILFVIGLVCYKLIPSFSDLFGSNKAEEKEAAIATAEHNDALIAPVKKPLPANKKKAPAVATANVKAADAHLSAVIAGYQPFSINANNRAALMKLAKQMRTYQASFSGVRSEYKKLRGNDLIADVRSTMGEDYMSWLTLASQTK